MKKRILMMLLAIVMLVGMLPLMTNTAEAATAVSSSDLVSLNRNSATVNNTFKFVIKTTDDCDASAGNCNASYVLIDFEGNDQKISLNESLMHNKGNTKEASLTSTVLPGSATLYLASGISSLRTYKCEVSAYWNNNLIGTVSLSQTGGGNTYAKDFAYNESSAAFPKIGTAKIDVSNKNLTANANGTQVTANFSIDATTNYGYDAYGGRAISVTNGSITVDNVLGGWVLKNTVRTVNTSQQNTTIPGVSLSVGTNSRSVQVNSSDFIANYAGTSVQFKVAAELCMVAGGYRWGNTKTVYSDTITLSKPTYTVNFNANGGSGSMNSQTLYYGNESNRAALLQNTYTRYGYTFAGWNTQSNGSGTSYADKASVLNLTTGSSTTLYAQWTPNPYTITLDANGGTINNGNVTSYTYGTGATLPTNVTKAGYTFGGWYEDANFSGSAVTAIGNTETGNKTFYARWTANTYTVSFNANGGSATPASATVTYGSTYGTLPTPTRPHHTFNGWFTAASGGTEVTSTTQVTATADHSIYAQWTPISHPICGASCTGTHGGASGDTHGNVTWTAWNGGEIPYNNNEAYIFLSANTNSSIEVNGGKTLYLCLNGKTLDGGSDAAIKIGQNGTVIICDCSGGKGSITASSGFGRGIYSTDASAKTTLYGVTISGCSYAGIECRAGVVNLYDSSIVECTGSRGAIEMQYSTGVVRLFNSDITNCSSSASGSTSAAYVSENATLELHGDCDISECSGKAIYLNGTLKLAGNYMQMTLPTIEIGSKGTFDVTDLNNLTSGPCIQVNPWQISSGTGIVLARGTADPSRFTFTDSYNIYTYGKENQVFMVKPWSLAWSHADDVLADYPQGGAWYKGGANITVTPKDGVTLYEELGSGVWNPSTFNVGNTTKKVDVEKIIFAYNSANKTYYKLALTYKVDAVAPTIKVENLPNEGEYFSTRNVYLTISDDVNYSSDLNVTVICNGRNYELSGSPRYFKADQNGIYVITATDKVGNVTTVHQEINFIDGAAPVINSVTVSPSQPDGENGWYITQPTVTVSAEDSQSGLADKAYSFDGGRTWQASASKTFSDGTHTVIIQVKDKANKVATHSKQYTLKVDTVAPTAPVSGNPVNWTKDDVTLTVTATDETSGVAAYSFDGGSTWQALNTNTYTENTANIVIRVKDNAGNARICDTVAITKIDKTAPEAAFGTLPTATGENGWYTANVDIPVVVSDANLKEWKYQLNDGSWTKGTGNSFTISVDDTYSVKIKAIDQAGNETEAAPITIKLDKTASVISNITGNPTSWVADSAVIRFTASDATAGIASVKVTRNAVDYPVNANSFTADQNGNYIIKVIDHAGHETTETVVVTKIDVTAPSAEFGTFADPDSTGWYKADVTIPVTVSDVEELSKWYYSLDNGTTWTEGNGSSFTISENGDYTNKVKIKAVDAVGKETVAGPISVKLDKATPAAPTVIAKVDNIVYSSGTWTTGNVVFTLSGGITTSGIDTYQYSTDGGNNWTDMPDNTVTHTASTNDIGVTYIFRAVNNAGTEGTVSGSTKVLKRQPYTILFSANAEDATGTMGNLTAYLDTNVLLTANAFERKGYSFMGWATTADGDVTYTNKQNVPEALTDQMNAEVTLYAVWSENPVVSGTITGTNDTNVTVRLRDLEGNEYPAVVTPSGDDFIYTVSVPVGYYQLIVEAKVSTDSVTLTYAEDVSASKTHNIAIPTGNMNSSVVEIADDASKAIVDGLEAIALADPGNGVEIKLTVTAEERSSSDAEQNAIRTEARGKALQFVDLTLTKNGSDIGSDNAQLLTIVIPFETDDKQTITIYRYHDDKAEALDEDPTAGNEGFVVGTGSITIYAKKFSTYAIGYTYYTTTYSVVVEDTMNGTVKANSNYATSGSTVTILVTPDKGYTLETLTVTDKGGKSVELTKLSSTKYTFKMPEAKVTVKATFKEEVAFQNPFKDVFATDYYYDAVLWAAKEGITNGTGATTFSPNAPCTRAQMVTFLWRAAGSLEATATACPFTDVDVDSYYGKAVLWAVEHGITKGTSVTTFSPDMACSRAHTVTFLCRMAGGKAESSINAFTDVKANAYYAESVRWAVENGITNGTSKTTFSPDAPCTRGQMVTFLYRYYN